MKLILASNNPHKIREICSITESMSLHVVSAAEAGWTGEIEEDGMTFEENAAKKARTIAVALKEWAMADDSGLEVYALQMRPGVFSARYAGEPVDYKKNNEKLLKEMTNISDRRARFCCVIALSDPSGKIETVAGICEGHVIFEPRGTNGFGYDPLFVPDGYNLTFAELPSEIKNKISHRARAVHAAMEKWKHIFKSH